MSKENHHERQFGRVVKASDSKSLGVSRAGSNPAVVVAFCLSHLHNRSTLFVNQERSLLYSRFERAVACLPIGFNCLLYDPKENCQFEYDVSHTRKICCSHSCSSMPLLKRVMSLFYEYRILLHEFSTYLQFTFHMQ